MPKKILVVDDNEGDRELLVEALDNLEIDVSLISAESGDKGIQIAKDDKPDLILMDIMMPGLNGGDAVKTLKDDPRTSHIPVVFLTGMYSKGEESSKKKVNIAGEFYDTLAKPISQENLISMINKYIW